MVTSNLTVVLVHQTTFQTTRCCHCCCCCCDCCCGRGQMVGGPPTPRDRLCAAAAKTPRSVAASCTHGSQHTLMIMPYTNLPLFLSLYPTYDLWLVICLSVHSRVITLLPPPAPTRPLINSTIPINSVHILI